MLTNWYCFARILRFFLDNRVLSTRPFALGCVDKLELMMSPASVFVVERRTDDSLSWSAGTLRSSDVRTSEMVVKRTSSDFSKRASILDMSSCPGPFSFEASQAIFARLRNLRKWVKTKLRAVEGQEDMATCFADSFSSDMRRREGRGNKDVSVVRGCPWC